MYAIMLVSTHALINVMWFTIMVILFSKLKIAAKNEKFQRILKGVTGVVFVGFGAKLLALENK
jgi:threonine/homoserine/homoserine lactone efflux protein